MVNFDFVAQMIHFLGSKPHIGHYKCSCFVQKYLPWHTPARPGAKPVHVMQLAKSRPPEKPTALAISLANDPCQESQPNACPRRSHSSLV